MTTYPEWPFGTTLNMEGRPTREQMERLEDFLTELKLLSARYGLLIDTYVESEERPVVRDVHTGTTLGLQLSYFVKPEDPEQVTGYDFMGGSILDGSWPVETENGIIEMRHLDGRAQRVQKGIPPR